MASAEFTADLIRSTHSASGVCTFCHEKIGYVDYKDTNLLRKYISDRGKIRARRVTGNCTRHQRDVATAIKNAREMALLPYTSTAR